MGNTDSVSMLDLYAKSESISKAEKSAGKSLILKGWIYRKRSSGGKLFAIIRDSTGIMQCVVDKSIVNEKQWSDIDKAHLESSVIIKGTVRQDKRAPGGAEIDVKELRVVHSGTEFPITEYQSPEFLLDVRHLWLRSQRMRFIMQARSYFLRYLREYLDKEGFYEITPPVLTTIGGETGANLFEVQYFDRKVYLTESSQFYAEAMEFSLGKVYSFVPSFRAEKSRTLKHLAEFWQVEPDMIYYTNEMSMRLQEELVSYIANRIAKHEDIMEGLKVDAGQLMKVRPPFKRISYGDAIKLLNERGSQIKWGMDFGMGEEKLLTEGEDKPIFVHSWPKEIKPFYMPINEDGKTAECSDMLAPDGHGEIIGGGGREWKIDKLLARMREFKLDVRKYQWYIDLRRYGSVPHSGFGIGVERTIKWMLNLEHIRDAIPFPRLINRLTP